ncbi:MAG: response regulator [Candidatus Eisenbacteria bacterium]|nr:response regulator [Candidatus Eisenbacteria bacterium]
MSAHGRILIVDDEETFRESTAEILRGEGYDCDSAPDSARAAVLLADHEYDLVIADIFMPLSLIHI